MTVGWIIVSFFSTPNTTRLPSMSTDWPLALFVGASMAEILSSIPTSGGPYFWAYMLAPQGKAPFFAWVTGW